jgi:hypothetical protein
MTEQQSKIQQIIDIVQMPPIADIEHDVSDWTVILYFD